MIFSSCRQNHMEHSIYGKWRVKFNSGPMAEARFHSNGTHDFYIDGKLFSSGKSTFRSDTLKAYDPICGGNGEYYGTYKVDFLGGDSIRFKVIDDSCRPRRFDMDGTVLHRIRKG
ncbi:hypothetical protein DLD77_06470 [Chitinophaga alhagiae]|uniref:Lipocalin-like domain-containing protein n=1 Tax=Chitinophaga alhagiae TaxID=2203219 RepID=A0ABM6WBW5_9BACT|nr:hypothetical protein DLD77_06470 [Chitinophaga alhagiae]